MVVWLQKNSFYLIPDLLVAPCPYTHVIENRCPKIRWNLRW